MSGDPLDRLQIPSPPSEEPGDDGVAVRPHPIAPLWHGACLRLAGEASSPTLVFRQREGKLTAISYSYLTALRLLPPGALEIDFVGYAVALRGRRLKPVFEAIAQQRALEIAESANTFDEDETAPFIETVSIVSTQER